MRLPSLISYVALSPAVVLGSSAALAQGTGPGTAQAAYLKASNPGPSDHFTNVAISGDTAVVGASGEDSGAAGVDGDQSDDSHIGAGAVYVHVRDANGWRQEAYLKASNPDPLDGFGGSVAIDGDTIVVGAYSEASNATGVNGNQADNSASGAGAAYVFVRSGGTWTQQAYLKASNTDPIDLFGASVAISGDTIVVGAVRESSAFGGVNANQGDNSAPNAGAAYVFVRNGTTWTQQAYLKASNPEGGSPGGHPLHGDRFGAVAISGDTIAVGAALEGSSARGIDGDQQNNDAPHSGAVYVFVRDGTTWRQQAYVKASNADALDHFGGVALSGDTMVVGASRERSATGDPTDNGLFGAGAAYVFERVGSTWSERAYLKPANIGDDSFGRSVGVTTVGGVSRVVVGADFEDGSAPGVDGVPDDLLTGAGAAYVFTRQGTTWRQSAYLKASNLDPNDQFGRSVAIHGDTTLVGAIRESSGAAGVDGDPFDNSTVHAGAVYVFDTTEPGTTFCASLPNSTGQTARLYASGKPGSSLALRAAPVPETAGAFFFGAMPQAGVPFGDGLLCIGGARQSMHPRLRAGRDGQAPGSAALEVDYTAPYAGGLTGTRYFQYWFRSGLVGGAGHNTSDGLAIGF